MFAEIERERLYFVIKLPVIGKFKRKRHFIRRFFVVSQYMIHAFGNLIVILLPPFDTVFARSLLPSSRPILCLRK